MPIFIHAWPAAFLWCLALLYFPMPGSITDFSKQMTVEATVLPDTIPLQRVDEQLIRELTQEPQLKTWRDSGYYFQLESIVWQTVRLGSASNDDMLILASFSSADPASLVFRGRAVFRFPMAEWPANITPARGMSGEGLIAFPQDVLFCPSPNQEVGLGQNDPYFPLYTTGFLTSVFLSPGTEQDLEIEVVVQLRDMEIIL